MENEGLPEPQLSDPKEKLILLVDDDESLLDIVEHVVRREGFRTDRAVDGPEALTKAEALLPDLILLDFMLPGKGGYEVIRDLQASGNGNIPVIVITGRQLDEKQIAMVRLESNVKDFLIKPMRPPVLVALIHNLLKTRPPDLDRTSRGRPMTGGL
ncbi:MAG: response regulator transcription factor [Elusimicrobia bacterium]|nr:response regulator transcription factor [Elusimicrobiota bacterium]